jgi:hypothetical protein
MSWIDAIPANRRRGSHPRCLLLMDGEAAVVAERLTRLVGCNGVVVPPNAARMPRGVPVLLDDERWDTTPTDEARLDLHFLNERQRSELKHWWLEVIPMANTPNWDIVSTCTVDGRAGLILVEAKAHQAELAGEEGGKRRPTTSNGWLNHRRIGTAIAEASAELQRASGLPWAISRDSRYQMSNRFAWAWKVASMGVPVCLLYLGFLGAKEMCDIGQPFNGADEWEEAVLSHSSGFIPARAWRTPINTDRFYLRPLIRHTQIALREIER